MVLDWYWPGSGSASGGLLYEEVGSLMVADYDFVLIGEASVLY